MRGLNEGADALTRKLDEVVRHFDPGLLVPVAEWSNRAAGAFSAAAKTLESVPEAVEGSRRSLSAVNADLEMVKRAAGELARVLTAETGHAAGVLAGELGRAGNVAGALGGAIGALQPASEGARVALERLGSQAGMGVTQFDQIRNSLDQVAVELGKVEGVLKAITDVNASDVKAPINRLVQALDTSATRTTTATERLETLNAELQGVRAASQDLLRAFGPEVAKPLTEHQWAVEGVGQQVARAEEQLRGVAKQLEVVVTSRKPQVELTAQLVARMAELQSELKETNTQIKALVKRMEGVPGSDGRTGLFGFRWFGRG